MLVGRLRRRWNAGLDAFYGCVRQCLIATDYQSPADPRSTAHFDRPIEPPFGAPLYSENHIHGPRRWIDEEAAVDLLFRIGVPGNRTEVQGRFQDD